MTCFLTGLVIFTYVYNIPFTNMPISGSKIVVLMLLMYLTVKRNHIVLQQPKQKLVVLVFLVLFYSELIRCINSSSDLSISYTLVLFLVNHIVGSMLIVVLLKSQGKLTIEDMARMLVWIATAQAILILLTILSGDIYRWVADFARLETRNSIYQRYNGARGYGLAASITYDLAVVQSFSLIFIVYLMQRTKKKIRYAAAYLLIVISIVVTGRTGVIGIFLSGLYYLKVNRKNTHKLLLYMLLVLAIVILGGICIFYTHTEEGILSSVRAYFFESIDNFIQTGRFSSATSDNLLVMVKSMRGVSLKTWLIGDGWYKGEERLYYKNVDIGYFRHIYYFGLIGCILVFLIYYYIYKKGLQSCRDRDFCLVWKTLFFYLLLAHFKGDFVLACGMGISVVMLLFLTLLEVKTENEKSFNCKPRKISQSWR